MKDIGNLRGALTLAVIGLTLLSSANVSRIDSDKCEFGRWTESLSKAQAKAKTAEALSASGFLIWNLSFNNGSCGHCDEADKGVFNTDWFYGWSEANKVVALHASAEKSSLDAVSKFVSYYHPSGDIPTPEFVLVDGRDGTSRFGTVDFQVNVTANGIFLSKLNKASFLAQIECLLNKADDKPYSEKKNGSKKLLNPQARVITPDAANATTLTKVGLWNAYGVNSLNCQQSIYSGVYKGTADDQYDWFKIQNVKGGTTYHLQGTVKDDLDIGRLCVFTEEKRALASTKYDVAVTNSDVTVKMNQLNQGWDFTVDKDQSAVYLLFTRRAADMSNKTKTKWENITLTYTFTIQEGSGEAYYFDHEALRYDETNLQARVSVKRTGSFAAAGSVLITNVVGQTGSLNWAKLGVDFTVPNWTVTFAPGQEASDFILNVIDRKRVIEGPRYIELEILGPTSTQPGQNPRTGITITDNNMVVDTPAQPDQGVVLPADGEIYTVDSVFTNLWFIIPKARTDKVYHFGVRPEALAQGDRIELGLCDASGKTLRAGRDITSLDEWSTFRFVPAEDGKDAYVYVRTSKKSIYDIALRAMGKPTVAFTAETQERANEKIAAPTASADWQFAVEQLIGGVRTGATNDLEVLVDVAAGTAVAGEDFVATNGLAVAFEQAAVASNAVRLLRAPGFRAAERTVRVAIAASEFYNLGNVTELTLTLAADVAGNPDGATAADAHRMTIDQDHGVTNWLSSGVRNLSGTCTNDWLVFEGVVVGKTYRLLADSVAEVPSDVVSCVDFMTNGVPGGLVYPLSFLATNSPCFTISEDFEGPALTCLVSRAVNDQALVQYELKLAEWVKPVFSFGVATASVDDTKPSEQITILRTANDLMDDVVYLTCDAKPQDGTAFDRVPVTIAAGDKMGYTNFLLNTVGKAGVWTGDRAVTFTLDVSDPSSMAKGTPDTLVLTLKDTDPEFETVGGAVDPDRDGVETADNALVRDEVDEDGVRASRSLHGRDMEDWFVFTNATAETTYRFQIPTNDLRNVTTAEMKADIVVPGEEKQTCTFDDLANTVEIVSSEDGDISVRVYRETVSTVEKPISAFYELSVTKWQRAKFSFAETAYAQDDTNATLTVQIRRQYNSETNNAVVVTAVDGTAKAGTDAPQAAYRALSKRVEFPAGAAGDIQSVTVELLPELEGYWTSNRWFKLELAVTDETLERAGDTEAIVTLLDIDDVADRKYDAADPGDRNSWNARVLGDVTNAAFKATGVMHLNGDDLCDWYRFDNITADENYRFGLRDFKTLNADGLNMTATFYVDNADDLNAPCTNIALSALAEMTAAGEYLAFRPETDDNIFVKVERGTRDVPVAVMYELVYRESPPSSATLSTNAVTVSEDAAAAYVDVICSVEPGQTLFDDAVVVVTPVDGTAVSPHDFDGRPIEVRWPAGSTGGRQRVGIPLTNYDSTWEGRETFSVRLDTLSDTEIVGIREAIVTIEEKDSGTVGTVGIVAAGADEGSLAPVTDKTVQTTRSGKTVAVQVKRVGGKSGAVQGVWKWMDGKKQVGETVTLQLFAGVSASESAVTNAVLTVPSIAGLQKSLTLNLTLKGPKGIALTKGTPKALKYTVSSEDYAGKVTAYAAGDPTKVAFRASGTSWYLTTGGAIQATTPKANASVVLSTTVTGPGELVFDAAFTEAEKCTLVAKGAASATYEAVDQTIRVPVAAGSKTVTVTFKRPKKDASDEASVMLSNIRFEPSAEFAKYGTFFGPATVDGVPGLATVSVASNGRLSGKLQSADGTWSFSLKSGWVAAEGPVEVSGKSTTLGKRILTLTANADGTVTLAGDGAGATLYRDGWADKPLSARFASAQNTVPGYYTATFPSADPEIAFGSGYLTTTIGKNGAVKATGALADGTSVTLSGTAMVAADGSAMLAFYASPSAYRHGWFACDAAIEVGSDGPVLTLPGPSGSWCRKDASGEPMWTRAVRVVGGFYDKAENLHDFYLGKSLSVGTVDEVSDLKVGKNLLEAKAWAAKDEETYGVALNFNAAGTKLTATQSSDRLFTVGFKPATGLFSGQFRATYYYPAGKSVRKVTRSFSYKGLLLPNRADGDNVEGRGFFVMPDYDNDEGKKTERSYELTIEAEAED